MEKFIRYVEEVISPNIKQNKEPLLTNEEAQVLKDKSDLIMEKFVVWKKSKQILITKSFEEYYFLPELVEFLETILVRSIPIRIFVSIDFFGIWRDGNVDEKYMQFVWASKATSMIKNMPANSRKEIDNIKNLIGTGKLFILNLIVTLLYRYWLPV